MQRIVLVRATTGEVIHPEVKVQPGDDAMKVSQPAAINFSVAPEWETMIAHDGSLMLENRKTLVVVEAANRQISSVGLVDSLDPQNGRLVVGAGGFSMAIRQSGPWEGRQGQYVTTDPVQLFRDVVEHVSSYQNSIAGIRVTGDTESGSMVGYPGSLRWQNAEQQIRSYEPELARWEARVLVRERELAQRQERMFRAAGLKRVGEVHVTEDGERPPDDPEYKADSTVWVREDNKRAYRWENGRWVARTVVNNDRVDSWLRYRNQPGIAEDEVDRVKYLIEPAQEILDQYEHEAREEYSLYFWQNHDMGDVIEDLMALGPFEFRERAAWVPDEGGNDRLDLQIEVGAPRVGVRREELHLEFGVNIQGDYTREYGPVYTGVAQFGAGSGSEVLSEQRDWNPRHVVRNIFTETDKDAHSRALVRAAANKLRDRAQGEAGIKFTNLTIFHDKACPVGSFEEGDTVRITGKLDGGIRVSQWVRIMEAKRIWGRDQTEVEVVNV